MAIAGIRLGREEWLPALRVGVSVTVPLVLAAAAGRLDLALYAVFGAMASIYGRQGTHVDRAVMQLSAAGVQVGAVVLGVVTSAATSSPWPAVVGVGVVAALAADISDVRRWRPPGALFAVFAYGASATAPATWSTVPVALAVSAGAAAFALAVGAVGGLLATHRRSGTTPTRPPVRPELLRRHAVGAAAAATPATALAPAWGSPLAYWAAVAAVVPLAAADVRGRLRRAWQRFAGTLVGLVVAALVLAAQPGEWAVVALVAVLQVATELVVIQRYALAMVFVTPMALLMTYLGRGSSDGLVLDRAATTAIGVLVGVAVILVQHDRRTEW